MKFELNADKVKAQAKNLASYLATINRKVTLGNAREAVAHMYGSKSWNVLSAQLKAETPEQACSPAAPAKYFFGENGPEAVATAEMVSDDHRAEVTFDVTRWLMTAKEEAVLELAGIDWYGDYAADAVSDAARGWNPEVAAVYAYLEVANDAKSMFVDDIGFCTTVNEEEALRFLRAFRYPLFLKLALKASGSSDEIYDVYSKHLDSLDEKYLSENWAEIERAWKEEPRAFPDSEAFNSAAEVTPCSGVVKATAVVEKVLGRLDAETGGVLVLKSGESHLSIEQLRKITDDARFPLQVAVPVGISQLIDGDIEVLNDMASEAITGSICGLTSISYERYIPADEGTLIDTKQELFILVSANWEIDDFLVDDEE